MITLIQFDGAFHVIDQWGVRLGVIHKAADQHVFTSVCHHMVFSTDLLNAITCAMEDLNGAE